MTTKYLSIYRKIMQVLLVAALFSTHSQAQQERDPVAATPGFYSKSFKEAGKDSNTTSCGQSALMEKLFQAHPEIRSRQLDIEQRYRNFSKAKNAQGPHALSAPAMLSTTVTLPVVVHIIHNNGPENISDAQVMTAIQHLNEAYANAGFYDPSDGVNTNIQFCMAERDPLNNPTNGITRDVSPYTVMGGPVYYSDDQNVKNINRWNPLCYINIWVVASIPGSVAGYAYLPSAHGSDLDGIVLEAGYFGSSYPNDVVVIHEMGHYLGLYHTFQGGCTNNDCSLDGDQICDTPPDQSTAYISCGSSMNSCSTDMLSGFASDQPDLTQDYMDYGNFNCMKVFTQDQSDRMNWSIQNVRESLLHCKSCLPPCPAPVTAVFSNPGATVNAGSSFTFINSSANAASYEWRVNGVTLSTATNFTYTFGAPGNYTIELIARSANPLCDSAVQQFPITTVCGVTASFTSSASTASAGTTINFTNTGTGANTYIWSVNGTPVSTSLNFSYTSATAGPYIITLQSSSTAGSCSQSVSATVTFTCPVISDFLPASITTPLNTLLTFTSTGSGASVYQWKINGVNAGSGPTLNYTFSTAGNYTVQLIAGNGICSSVKTGVVYVTDKCGNPVYLFRKTYNAGGAFYIRDMQYATDAGSVMAGQLSVGIPAAALIKLDASGNLQWFKTYGAGTLSDFIKVRSTADGGFIGIGNSTGTGGATNLFILKTAADGTLSWSRQLNLDGNTSGANIQPSAEGDYYFSGTISSVGAINGSSKQLLAGRLDAAGTLVWLQSYDAGSSATPEGLAVENTDLVVTGNLSASSGDPGFLMQLAKANGALIWSKSYQSVSENFKDVQAGAGGYLLDVLHSAAPGNAYGNHVILVTDATGNITYGATNTPFGAGTVIGYSSLLLKPNGHIISESSPLSTGAYADFLVQEIDPATGVVWTKKYNAPNTYIAALAKKPDNGFFLGGFTIAGAAVNAFEMSVDSLGAGGSCPAQDADLTVSTPLYQVRKSDWTVKNIQGRFISTLMATDQTATTNTICQSGSCDSTVDSCALCSTLRLVGKDTVCTSKLPMVYKAVRAAGCTTPVTWTVDDQYIQVIEQTDSTITILEKVAGNSLLIGTLATSCDTLRDSLTLVSYHQPDSLNLGPDILLCKQSTLALNAGSGFAHYQWQDGSLDSVFTAYFPGTYFVQATDFCGNSYRDTVVIALSPDIPFDLGPDTVICLHDSLSLAAPVGFLSYSWSPATYGINDPYSRTPLVSPGKDTSYTCVAEKYTGCTVLDSIHITVKTGFPQDFLDSVTSFCKGLSVVVAPAGDWSTYQWSTGANSKSITISTPGIYRLQVTDSNHCTGSDTVQVLETDCRQGIHFPNAFTPNTDGINDVFRPVYSEAPLNYSLIIYNRWGEKVFESRDPATGWNGLYKGVLQDSGGFAWYSNYTLGGNKTGELQKGMVLLIR